MKLVLGLESSGRETEWVTLKTSRSPQSMLEPVILIAPHLDLVDIVQGCILLSYIKYVPDLGDIEV